MYTNFKIIILILYFLDRLVCACFIMIEPTSYALCNPKNSNFPINFSFSSKYLYENAIDLKCKVDHGAPGL